VVVAAMIYGFGGFVVYWLISGSWTVVNERWYVSMIGTVVWLAPILTLGAPLFAPPSGMLRRLYHPVTTVTFGTDALSWSIRGQTSSVRWEQIRDVRNNASSWTYCIVEGVDGNDIVTLPDLVVDARNPIKGTAATFVRLSRRRQGVEFRLTDLIADVLARRILAERGTPAP
jgi:hypothetical protein